MATLDEPEVEPRGAEGIVVLEEGCALDILNGSWVLTDIKGDCSIGGSRSSCRDW